MPFKPIDFANIAPQGNPFLRDFVQTLTTGYQAGQLPGIMEREKQKAELANAMQKLLVEEQPEKFKSEQEGRVLSNEMQRLLNQEQPQKFGSEMSTAALNRALNQARINEIKAKLELPFAGNIPTGSIGQAFYLDMIGKKYGENSPVYQNAKRVFDADIAKSEELTNYRKELESTVGKRSSSPIAKMAIELSEISQGYLPGTNKTQTITPEQQIDLANKLALNIQKQSSDTDTRKRNLFAANIDKTLAEINVDDLTQYAGVKGGLKRISEESLAPFGRESQKYRDFQKSLTAAQFLAKQARQFYGDSIQPSMLEKLEKLTNPATWANNPNIAKQNFNEVVKILKKETGTYREAIKSPTAYEEPNQSGDNDPLGLR